MEEESVKFGGFWIRFIAYLIDGIIIGFFEWVLIIPLLGMLGYNAELLSSLEELDKMDPEYLIPLIATAGAGLYLSALLISWFYFALLQSGPRQATVGKMALGLKVTDVAGNRISFARASLRYFARYLSSAIFMIGYIMAGFTAKKQALHDIIANTYVVRSN